MKLIWHVALVCLVGFVVISVGHVRRVETEQHYKLVALRFTEQQSQRIAQAWRLGTFDAPDAPVVEQTISKKLRALPDPLTVEQVECFRADFFSFMRYLQEPSISRFLSFKTDGLHFSLAPFLNPADDSELPDEPLVRVAQHWHRVQAQNPNSMPLTITGINVASIRVDRVSTNAGVALLMGAVKQGFTIAHEAASSGIVYLNREDEPLLGLTGLFLDISFIGRSADSGTCAPLHMRFYWASEERRWILARLISDQVFGYKTVI